MEEGRKSYTACLKGWDVKRILGTGTFGEVVNACLKDDCKYAIKLAKINNNFTEEEYQREVDITREFAKLGVSPKFYDNWFCRSDGQQYGVIVMEKYDTSLYDYLKDNDLTERDFKKISNLVKVMHDAGIAHLDLKNENVVVKTSGKSPKFAFIDFGFSVHVFKDKPFESLTYEDMLSYYEDLYEECFEKSDRKKLRDIIVNRKKIDPRYLDDLFLCNLKRYVVK